MYLFDLDLNPISKPKSGKYTILEITDLQFHGNHKRPTENQGKKIVKAMQKLKPVRTFHKLEDIEQKDEDTLTTKSNILGFLFSDPYFSDYVKKEQAKGVTVILGLPEGGIPTFLAKDAEEFMKGIKGERKSRHIERNNDV
ncbi:MAG: hypothetical protein CMF25_03590 [Kangiellaceae bacterium]|nr:hypothetical protein [Kangiellaceae bacterium]|tara:strand:+ start:4721 stop:5143 length:423 start_codon:yes stop_codon:yes gene_type:complete